MKELIAKSEYTMTGEIFRAGSLAVWRARNGAFTKKAILAMAGLWLILAVVTAALKQNPAFIALEAVILTLMALWIAVYMPRRKARRGFRQLRDRCGAELERSVLFYEDSLRVEAAGQAPLRVDYAELGQPLREKELLILIANGKTGVIIPAGSFTQGSVETVLAQLALAKEAASEYSE